MRNRLIHTTKFVLLLLALLPSLTTLIFQAREKAIQQRMRKELDRHPLVTLHINTSEFNWIEEGKEIVVKGRMFDVKSLKVENGVCIVTGLFDDEETALFKLMKKNREDETSSGNRILEEFFGFEATHNELAYEPYSSATILRNHIGYTDAIMVTHIAVITPPPRC